MMQALSNWNFRICKFRAPKKVGYRSGGNFPQREHLQGWGWWRASNDLFNIVREMTRGPGSATSLQPAKQKQWSRLNCDITSCGTERNRGGLIKRRRGGWLCVKVTAHLPGLLNKKKKGVYIEKNSPMWLETTSNIFSNAISEIRW